MPIESTTNMKCPSSAPSLFPSLVLFFGLALNGVGVSAGTIEPKDVPAAVQATIKAKAGDKPVSKIETKIKGGKVSYAASIKGADGKVSIFTVNSEGKLSNVKDEVGMKDLPEPVQSAIKAKAGEKPISSIEKKTKDDKVTFTATAKATGGTAVLITVDSKGKVLKVADAKKEEATEEKAKAK